MKITDWVLLLALFTLLSFLWGVGDGSITIASKPQNIVIEEQK